MAFNTGNPIGSIDARDLSDNAENMDYLENSTTELTHADRLGTVRKTRHGMEVEHGKQIAAHEVEHDAQMQSFENDFDGRLAGMAFTRVGSFTTGATLTDMRQVLIWEVSQGGDGHEYSWAGIFPKVVAAGATPATSGGIGAGAWADRTDVTLREELIDNGSFDALHKIDNIVQSKPYNVLTESGLVWLLNTIAGRTQHAIFPTTDGDKFVMQQISQSDVAKSDANNVGGLACTRFNLAYVVKEVLVGQFNPFAKTVGVTASDSTYVSQANWEAAMGMLSSFGGLGYYKNAQYGFKNHITWCLPVGDSIEFSANGTTEIILWTANYLSSSVKIYTDAAVTGTYALVATISTVAAKAAALKYSVTANTKVKIENSDPASAYVYVLGCCVSSIKNASISKTYDSLIYYRDDAYPVYGDAYWLGGSAGANEIAMRPVGGKFFGSFHGGHSAETVASFIDGVAVNMDIPGTFAYGREINVIAESTLNSGAMTYDFSLKMCVGKGFEYSSVDVKPSTNAVSEPMRELFTCMTIANKRFDRLLRPEQTAISATIGAEKILTNTGSVVQYDKTRGHSIRTDFTTFNMVGASKSGAYIQTRDDDNKLYYNPTEDGSSYFAHLNTEIIRYFTSH